LRAEISERDAPPAEPRSISGAIKMKDSPGGAEADVAAEEEAGVEAEPGRATAALRGLGGISVRFLGDSWRKSMEIRWWI
jgi:hypothetical protein